jgi:demethylmenaquinone methyltransferase/2-methoxy-6-polyprenyl-1,4-benzoquinol methylase
MEGRFDKVYDHSYWKYDFIVNLFQLGRDQLHRTRALKLAGLKKGDNVLDICCGSGLSLEPIQSIIGPEGSILAIDANEKMLSIARKRAEKHHWKNIRFIQGDIRDFHTDQNADFAFFALCWYDPLIGAQWIKQVGHYLKPGKGILCFIDYKYPENWLKNIANPVLKLTVSWLGESYSVEDLKWEPLIEIGSLLDKPEFQTVYLDSLFVLWGKQKTFEDGPDQTA